MRFIYLAVFFFSGVSGLIYESIWSHYLKLFLGNAASAQALVLIIFMGGMAVGAWVVGRFTHRLTNPFRVYALIELALGVGALSFHSIYLYLTDFVFFSVAPELSGSSIDAVKYLSAALLILPQSILLGATFPVMAAAFVRKIQTKPGRGISVLYAVNSFGAALGVLFSGFYLIEMLGLPGTVMIAGGINVLLFAVVWMVSRDELGDRNFSDVDGYPTADSGSKVARVFVLLLLCSLVTGFASFMYEIAWLRMLAMVLGSSSHAFELMLSAFILGLALGGWWIRKHIDALNSPGCVLAIIQMIMAVLAILTLVFYNLTFDAVIWMLSGLQKTDQGYTLFNIGSHAIAALIMIPPAVCAGMTLPLLTHTLMKSGYRERSIGYVYAFNTLGSILGVLVAVHLVMPVLGVKNVVVIGALFDALVGAVLLWYFGSSTTVWKRAAGFSVAAVVAVSGIMISLDRNVMAQGVFRRGVVLDDAFFDLKYYRDGKVSSVAIFDNPMAGQRSISTNGKVDAAINMGAQRDSLDEKTMTLLALLPLAVKSDVRDVAVIGFGSGMSTHGVLGSNIVESVDTIEIEPAMIEGAKFFGRKVMRAFNDNRSHIHIDDAKTFFARNEKTYDLIISEPSNPWVSGVSSLFTQEFYSRVGDSYLNEDGIFVQWFHLYEMNIPLLASVMKAVGNSFSDYVIYQASPADIVIMAKKSGPVPLLSQTLFSMPEVASMLSRVGISNLRDLDLLYVGDRKRLAGFFNSYNVPANSDFYPVLDVGAVKARYLQEDALKILEINNFAYPSGILGQRQTDDLLSFELLDRPEYRLANSARQVMNYIAGEAGVVDPNYQFSIHALMSGSECIKNTARDVWLASLHQIMFLLMPRLNELQMEAVLEGISSVDCAGSLGNNPHWLALYKAVASRQHAEVIRLSAFLNKQITTEEMGREIQIYTLYLASLSLLSQGDGQSSLQILLTMDASIRDTVMWRYLYGLSRWDG